MELNSRFFALLIWLVVMLICVWLAVTRAPVTTDLDAFMPEGGGAARLLSELRAGPAQRLILIGIAGGAEASRAQLSAELAERLRSSELFARVANGQDLMDVVEQRRLFSHRYLLSPEVKASDFTAESLRRALEARLVELQSASPVTDTRTLTADPTRELYAILRAWTGGNRPDTRHGVWFSRDGEYAVLLAETKAAGFDLDAQTRVVTAIEGAFANAAEKQWGMTLALSGPAIFATAAQDSIRATVKRLSAAASLATALILWLAYRSWRALLLAMLPLASAILVAIAAAGVVFGKLYGITLAFGMTLLGVAMDYPVHLFSHRSPAEPVAVTLRHVWPILRLGVVSTALGYAAMITAELAGLRQLGVFAVVGLLTAAAVTRWVLPALLPAGWAPNNMGAGAWMDAWLAPRAWTPPLLLMICAVALLATILIEPRLWEEDLASLSPVPTEQLTVDRELRGALGAPDAGHLALITAPNLQTALVRSEVLSAKLDKAVNRGLLDGFEMASRYLPSVSRQRERQGALPPREELQANLQQALRGMPFKRGAFEPFVEDVTQARTAEPLQLPVLEGSALGARVGSLLFKHDRGWLALTALIGVNDPEALRAWFAGHANEARYLDIGDATRGLMTHFRSTSIERAAWGALAIVGLLAVGLRNFRAVAAAVTPVALAVCVTVCALLALEDGGLTLFHVVSLLLVVGICIDYSLFFSHSGQDHVTRRRTLHAVVVCAGSTIAVFAMLALSSIPVLRAIGLTVAIGVAVSFVLALGLASRITGADKGLSPA